MMSIKLFASAHKKFIFLVVLFVLSSSLCLMAQPNTVRVYGFVKDRSNEPIMLASVKVTGSAIGAATNNKGAYSFTIVPRNDSLTIEVSCIGYKTVSHVFPKGITQPQRIDFTLPNADFLLDAVTVTAEQQKKQNMEQIKASHIKVVSGPTGGVESLVSTYAGVTQNNEISSQYSVRGGSFDENMVYVNGMEVFRPLLVRSAQQEGLSFVQPEMVQHVNFSAGGYSAEYGDKMSSVLDIRYKTPSSLEGSIGLGLQSDNLYIGTKKGPFSVIAGARFKDGRNLLKGLDTKGEYRPLYADGQTYIQYNFSQKWKLSFLGNISFTNYSFIPQTRETNFGTATQVKNLKVYFDGRERDRFLSYFGNLQLSFVQTDNVYHTLSIVGYKSLEEETYDIEGSYFLADLDEKNKEKNNPSTSLSALATGSSIEHARNKLNYSIATASYRLYWNFSALHKLKAGIDFRGEWVNDRIAEWSMLDSAGYNIPHNEQQIKLLYNLYSNNHISSFRSSIFVVDEMNFKTKQGQWQLFPGVRVSYYRFNNELIASPRFVASFSPVQYPKLTFRMATGMYYQAPFYKELRRVEHDNNGNNIVVLNNDIKSQGSIHLLLGSDYQFSLMNRRFRFSAEAYFKYLFHLNPYRVENVKVRYLGKNSGHGYVTGIDLKLYGEFVPEVDSWLTFSLLQSKQVIPQLGTMPLPNAPKYNFSLFFQDYFPGYKPIRLSLRGVLSGGLPQFRPSSSFEAPLFTGKAYTRVDMGLIYRIIDQKRRKTANWLQWAKSLDIAVDLFNLFDNANVSGYYWITDANNHQFAVPNYLTRRQLNFRLVAEF